MTAGVENTVRKAPRVAFRRRTRRRRGERQCRRGDSGAVAGVCSVHVFSHHIILHSSWIVRQRRAVVRRLPLSRCTAGITFSCVSVNLSLTVPVQRIASSPDTMVGVRVPVLPCDAVPTSVRELFACQFCSSSAALMLSAVASVNISSLSGVASLACATFKTGVSGIADVPSWLSGYVACWKPQAHAQPQITQRSAYDPKLFLMAYGGRRACMKND